MFCECTLLRYILYIGTDDSADVYSADNKTSFFAIEKEDAFTKNPSYPFLLYSLNGQKYTIKHFQNIKFLVFKIRDILNHFS